MASEPLEDRRLLAITVDTLIDEADGSIVDGDVSLRDAIALAPIGETIDFSVAGTINLTLGELLIERDLTIDGPGAAQLTIDAGDSSRIFNLDDGLVAIGDVEINGLTLTGGHADGHGGAIRSLESLTLVASVVTDNRAANGADGGSGNDGENGFHGGGIWASGDGLTTITDSTIAGNHAGDGGQGGAYGGSGGTGGVGGNGGGLAIDGDASITASTISGNTAGQGGFSTYSIFAASGGSGGGIWIAGDLVISTSTISGNTSGAGGDAYNYDSGNGGASGPGGGIASTGNLTVQHSLISGNMVGEPGQDKSPSNYASAGRGAPGGGIYSLSGTLVVVRSTITDNAAGEGGNGTGIRSRGAPGGSGGGVYARGSTLTVTESTVSVNRTGYGGFSPKTFAGGAAAGDGGGIWSDSTTTITSSTISGNTTGAGGSVGEYSSGVPGGNGGGLFTSASSTITHSTVAGNTTGRGGSNYGIYADDGLGGGVYGDVRLIHTIVAGNNRPTDGPSDVEGTAIALSSSNLIGVDTGLTGISNGVAGNQIGTLPTPIDPLLGPLADNGGPTFTHALASTSPAIDAGDVGFTPPPLLDQRGFQRAVDGDGDLTPRIDIGAFEYAPPLVGDGNLDGKVDGLDYLVWADHFADNPALDPPGSPANGDYNDDGIVNGLDYLAWADNFGAGVAPTTPAAQQRAAVDAALEQETDGTALFWAAKTLLDDGVDDDALTKSADAALEYAPVKKRPRRR